MIKIIETIWSYETDQEKFKSFLDEFKKCMNRDGLIIFFLNVIFKKNQPLRARISVAKLVKSIIKYDSEASSHVEAYMPIEFLTMMEHAQGFEDTESLDAQVS